MIWRYFIVGMLVGGGLVVLGIVLGVDLVASRPPIASASTPTAGSEPAGAGPFGLLPGVAAPVSTPTPIPTATPIPIVSCTVASSQGNATIAFAAPAPNELCQAFTQVQPDLPSRSFALCQAAGLNPVTAVACSVVLRRYLGSLSATPGDAGSGQSVCRGNYGNGTYAVRDTGSQYVGRALCGYLASGVSPTARPSP
jgi:hypothetical protein